MPPRRARPSPSAPRPEGGARSGVRRSAVAAALVLLSVLTNNVLAKERGINSSKRSAAGARPWQAAQNIQHGEVSQSATTRSADSRGKRTENVQQNEDNRRTREVTVQGRRGSDRIVIIIMNSSTTRGARTGGGQRNTTTTENSVHRSAQHCGGSFGANERTNAEAATALGDDVVVVLEELLERRDGRVRVVLVRRVLPHRALLEGRDSLVRAVSLE